MSLIKDILELQEQIKSLEAALKYKKEELLQEAKPGDKFNEENGSVTIFVQNRFKLKKGLDEADLAEKFPQYKQIKLTKEFFSDLDAEEYIESTESVAVRVTVKDPF